MTRNKDRRAQTAKSPRKRGAAFFEYVCRIGSSSYRPKQGLIALVLDAETEFGLSRSVHVEPDGRQLAMLRVFSEEGVFVVPAYTRTGKGDRLKPDDVVVWAPVETAGKAEEIPGDARRRSGSVGFIVAKVAPEIDATGSGLKIISRYD